jgi:hypothetical protein
MRSLQEGESIVLSRDVWLYADFLASSAAHQYMRTRVASGQFPYAVLQG